MQQGGQEQVPHVRSARMLQAMSRENKLALIIGFGLVLFVGVLVSDHLSANQRELTSNLHTSIDTSLLDHVPGSVLVEFGTEISEPDEDTNSLPANTIAAPLSPTLSTPDPMHTVAEGETLRSICRSWYGNPALANALATYNNLPDPDRLAPGLRLIMPNAGELGVSAEPVVTMGAPIESNATMVMGTYTVQSGDTLSEIAQKLMGTARATASLYELNRSVLPDMNALRVGMVLQYPLPSS